MLCAAAGGVDAFLIGSELRGLTRVRDSADELSRGRGAEDARRRCARHPGQRHEDRLCRRLVGIQQPPDRRRGGRAAVQSRSAVVATPISISSASTTTCRWPTGATARCSLDYDAVHGPTSIHDPAYLTANIRGGEDYDWYYASDADRDAQTRTPITDGLGKPWVWRAKDFWNWWSNAHYDRPDGTRERYAHRVGAAGQADLVHASSAVRPIDKGANQPNVFFDPKSSESALPYYSNGERDDLIQRRVPSRRISLSGAMPRTIRRRWLRRPHGRHDAHLSSGAGTRGRFRSSRRAPMCGATPPTISSATG